MINEEPASMGLLKTKYRLPGLNKHLLPRNLLDDRLEESLSKKLTIITAPAGYGKTTAVLKWLEGVGLPSAWLSLDTNDNDARIFWRYICAALDSISEGFSIATEYIFTSPELFEAGMHINILIDRLSDIKQDFIFVLDDLHVITNQEVLNSLLFFISYLPSNIHLVLISRIEPRMKLARLGLREDLVRLRVNDLRFNTGEIEQFFKARGYSLQEENIQKIESYTEGWAVALVAAAMSLKDEEHRSSIINIFASCNLQIENYLAEDVINTWTEKQWKFMEETSICDKLCGSLCEAIAGPDGSRLLNELYDQNSFLFALDENHTWFRFHHLFLDFLRKRQEKNIPLIRDLHNRAGDWLVENGFYEDAVDHYLQATHYEAAMALMEEKLFFPMIFQGVYSKGLSWLKRVPDKYKKNSSPAMFFEMYYFASVGEFQKALEFVQKVEHFMKMNAPVSDALQLQYILSKINIFFRQGDTKALLQLLNHLPSLTPSDITVNYVDFNLHDISCYRTQLQLFIKLFKENPAEFYSLTGNFGALFRTMAGYRPLVVGEYHYEIGNLADAIPQLTAAIDEAVNAGCLGALVPAMVTLSKIRRSRGDLEEAMEIIEECEKSVENFHKPHWAYILKAFKVRLYIDRNDTEKIDKWIQESRLGMFQNINRVREFELIVLARVFIYQQRYDDARILLCRLLEFAEHLNRSHSMVEIYNLLAINALKNQEEESAVEHLEKALIIGMKESYARSFIDELSPMVSLLNLYIGKHKKGGRLTTYASKLLSQTKDNIMLFPAASNAIENILTSAEKRVLQLLLKAYTNQEIADTLNITIRTVKAHTGNIYKKLGVKNRIECMQKANT